MVMATDFYGGSAQHPALRGISQANQSGYESVFYDPKTGQMMRTNPEYNQYTRSGPQYIPVSGIGGLQPGPTAYTPPTVDFNTLPQQTIPQAQPYVRPNAPAQNTGSGYRPQFDSSFIQQMLAQRFGNQQPGAGIPAMARPTGPATLTPGVFSGTGQGGLAALRSISGPTPVAPTGGIPSAT
jgi:hypothetical protein